MRLTNVQMEQLVRKVFTEMKSKSLIEFKEPEDKVFKRAVAIVQKDFDREVELDREVYRMMDDLERKNPGEFERGKMFPLLKKRMAKEKGIIL